MIVEQENMFTGELNSMDLDITEEQIARYENGELLQNAFPNLTPDEREFIKTGLLPGQWDEMFNNDEGRAETNGM